MSKPLIIDYNARPDETHLPCPACGAGMELPDLFLWWCPQCGTIQRDQDVSTGKHFLTNMERRRQRYSNRKTI